MDQVFDDRVRSKGPGQGEHQIGIGMQQLVCKKAGCINWALWQSDMC